MSVSWIQGGQPAIRPTQRSANPPPTCFNCGITGHFVVDCPESQQRQAPASFQQLPTNSYQQYPAPQSSWPPQPVAPQNQYAPYPTVQQPQYVPQPLAAQQPYIQPQQPYSAQTSNQQYGRLPYQAPTPQFPGPPQIGGQGYPVQQSYGPQAVAPYQPPLQNNYSQSTPYGGVSQGPQHSFSNQNPAPQWNSSQSPAQQNFQAPQQRSNSVAQNSYFRAPSQQPPIWQPNHSLPRQQSFDHGSKGSFQTQQIRNPVTQGLNHSAVPQYLVQTLHQSRTHPESMANSVTSTLNPSVESTIVVEMPKDRPDPSSKGLEELQEEDNEQEEKPEEGEFGPEDEAEEGFQWDCEHAFEEIIPKETVALAQPLSASFKSTPVPLIQAWSTKIPSISRYARKDNVIEYVRSIRSSPQWSYLQEDPAFTDNDLEGALIPFDDVPAWATARHKLMAMEETDPGWGKSRKRPRDEDAGGYAEREASYQESETSLETMDVGTDAPHSKRQKQEVSGAVDDEVMDETRGTTPGSMIVIPNARGGTPCLLNNLHDTWAPEPGERATSPPDPTEQLLASLGVSGDAKPVKQKELPPYTGTEEDASSRTASQTPASTRMLQANPVQHHALPMNQNYPNANGTAFNHNRTMSDNGTPIYGMHGNQNCVPFDGGNGQNMNGQISGQPLNNNFTNNYSKGPSHGYPNEPPINAPPMNVPPMDVLPVNAPPISVPPVPLVNAPAMNVPSMSGHPMGGFPKRHTQINGTPINAPNMNNGYIAPPVAQNQYGPPNMGYVPPVQPNYQNAPLLNNSYQPNPHYGQLVNGAFGTGAQGPHVQPGYGPPVMTQYTNGPSNNYSQDNPQESPQGPPQYAQNQASGHGGPDASQGYNQFGSPIPYATGSQPTALYSQPQYGPPANQAYSNGPAINHQPAPQYGPQQPQAQPFGNIQQTSNAYGATTQMSPAQYGPPQVPQYEGHGGYQAQSYQNGPNLQYTNRPPANFQSSASPSSQMPFNSALPNNVPQRQDSGYYSTGGSFSNGPGSNDLNGQNGILPDTQQAPNRFNSQNGQPPHIQKVQHGINNENAPPQQHEFSQGKNGSDQNGMGPSPPINHAPVQSSDQLALQDITNGKSENIISTNGESKKNRNKQDSDATLTDLERELLGELEPTPARRNPARKAAVKKPQPVVEAAYGRRW